MSYSETDSTVKLNVHCDSFTQGLRAIRDWLAAFDLHPARFDYSDTEIDNTVCVLVYFASPEDARTFSTRFGGTLA